MVQRQRARERPQEEDGYSIGVVSKEVVDHARGGGDSDSSSVVPGYMRATSSSGAKAGRVAAGGGVEGSGSSVLPERREPVRGAKVAFAGSGPRCASRATCSSSMKGPAAAAAAAGRVCPYAYCSLKGHVHAPVVPLRSFLASERRLIKTQQSMKHRGVSAFRKANNGGASGDGFLVEIFAGTGATASVSAASSDAGCSDLSTEEMDAMAGRRMDFVTFDHQSCRDAEDKLKDPDVSGDSSCGSSDVISDGLAEFTTKSRGRRKDNVEDDDEASVDQEEFGACKSDISELDAKYEDRSKDATVESSLDDISSGFGGMNFEDAGFDSTDAVTSQRNKLVISRRRTPTKEAAAQIRTFNPRAPNFLPVEPDTDPEKVDLRHQVTDDRKSAEEWMVDYALRRTVNKLARAQKRKVEMLVRAFETVLPPVQGEEKSEQQVDNEKDFTQTGSCQACN